MYIWKFQTFLYILHDSYLYHIPSPPHTFTLSSQITIYFPCSSVSFVRMSLRHLLFSFVPFPAPPFFVVVWRTLSFHFFLHIYHLSLHLLFILASEFIFCTLLFIPLSHSSFFIRLSFLLVRQHHDVDRRAKGS